MTQLSFAAVEWLAPGTFGFWAAVAIAAVVFIAAIVSEGYGFASVWCVGFVVFLQALAGVAVLSTIVAHPWLCLAGAAIYLPAGVVWALFRWNWFVGSSITQLRDSFAGSKPWPEYLDQYCPKANREKSRICGYIAYWPVSILAFVFSDFIAEVAEKVYAMVAKWFEAIVVRQKQKASKDIP